MRRGLRQLTEGKRNTRFIVTDIRGDVDLAKASGTMFANGQSLYEQFYCARGDMESSGAR